MKALVQVRIENDLRISPRALITGLRDLDTVPLIYLTYNRLSSDQKKE